jgi:5,10-methylenetetrahydromethanopterin reductase
MVGLHRDAVAAARRHLESGARRAGRSLDGFRTVFIVSIALAEDQATAHRWPQRWFAPGHPWLTYPSASNLYWLRQAGLPVPDAPTPEAVPDDLAARISDAFGLFGPPERCADRLLQAREIEAFRRVIRPRLMR